MEIILQIGHKGFGVRVKSRFLIAEFTRGEEINNQRLVYGHVTKRVVHMGLKRICNSKGNKIRRGTFTNHMDSFISIFE